VLRAGEQLYCALSWGEELAVPMSVEEANAQLTATTEFWRNWLGRARIPDHELGPLIQRSALVIKGLTYMPTGATVAALTTSLPETPGGERNWDYRYTWIRDSTFTLQALHFLDLDWEADEFIQFIADLECNDDGALQIMYGIDGRRELNETLREELSGYANARPVRIGNGAFDQRQNDLMERLVRIASPLGLYAEEFDVDTGRHLGNFPQAFSHLAAVEAASAIVLAERLAEIVG
jgi:GH15 family glucan-1,4-alpha-glucosidase